MVTMMTEMIGSPMRRRRNMRSNTHGKEEGHHHADQKRDVERDAQPNGQGVCDEGTGSDDLAVGDVEHPAGFVDQYKA